MRDVINLTCSHGQRAVTLVLLQPVTGMSMSAMKDSVRFMRRAYSHFRQYGMGGVRRYLRGKGVNLPSCSGLFHLVSLRRVSFPEWALPPANRPTHQIVVGVIADEFFRRAFEYEWTAI